MDPTGNKQMAVLSDGHFNPMESTSKPINLWSLDFAGQAFCWEHQDSSAGFPWTADGPGSAVLGVILQLSSDIVADVLPAEAAPCGFSIRSADARPGMWEVSRTETLEELREACQTFPLMNWPGGCCKLPRPQDPFQG